MSQIGLILPTVVLVSSIKCKTHFHHYPQTLNVVYSVKTLFKISCLLQLLRCSLSANFADLISFPILSILVTSVLLPAVSQSLWHEFCIFQELCCTKDLHLFFILSECLIHFFMFISILTHNFFSPP